MTRSFLRSLVGIALLAILVLLFAIDVWQRDRTERRLIALEDRVDRIEQGAQGEAKGSGRPARRGGIWGVAPPDYVAAAMADPSNLLSEDPALRLPDDAVQGGTLVLHLPADPPGYNLLAQRGTDVEELAFFAVPPLIGQHRSDPSRWSPGPACRVTTPDQGLTWIVELRRDLVWQEPVVDWASGRFEWLRGEHKVTARDVVFMMDMTLNPQVVGMAPMRAFLDDLEGYRAIDDWTFEIRFRERHFNQRSVVLPSLLPVAEFLYAFDEDGHRFDPESIGQRVQEHWYPMMLGYGPYLMTDVEPGSRVVMERNPFWPLGNNAFDEVVYLVLPDQNQPPRMLRTGELDLAWLQPGQYRAEILDGAQDSPFRSGALEHGDCWESSWSYIGWNMRRPPFDDVRVRQAMSHAFDGDRMLRDVFAGLGARNSGPLPSFSPAANPDVAPWPFDLAAAARLLDEAGWVDSDGDGIRDRAIGGERRPLAFALSIYGQSPEYRTLSSIFKEDLAQIGVRMEIRALEWGLLLQVKDDRDFDAITLSWGGTLEPEFSQIWHGSQADQPGSSNHVGYHNPEADAIIDAMDVVFDREERVGLVRRFHALVAGEQPYTFFYTRRRPMFWQPDLENVSFGLVRPYRDHRPWYFRPERAGR